MAMCKVIDLTPSDGDSDGAIEESHPFVSVSSFCILRQVQVSTTTEIISQDSCMYVVSIVVSRSQPDSFA